MEEWMSAEREDRKFIQSDVKAAVDDAAKEMAVAHFEFGYGVSYFCAAVRSTRYPQKHYAYALAFI